MFSSLWYCLPILSLQLSSVIGSTGWGDGICLLAGCLLVYSFSKYTDFICCAMKGNLYLSITTYSFNSVFRFHRKSIRCTKYRFPICKPIFARQSKCLTFRSQIYVQIQHSHIRANQLCLEPCLIIDYAVSTCLEPPSRFCCLSARQAVSLLSNTVYSNRRVSSTNKI